MKEIYKKVPMLFIITTAILGGSAVFHFQLTFSTYGDPIMSMGDPLWVYIFICLFETLKTTIYYSFYFVIVYYLSKLIIQSLYVYIRNLLSTFTPTA
ncbi:hypothetical protein MKZ26_20090 [Sporosarcina sp. FSL K6-6792]|uniref:hypothetical protein n=1 Tax=Sporosarcina sp. FSL K6-6792 TaxID=2921559 RepID=UPI0030FB3558